MLSTDLYKIFSEFISNMLVSANEKFMTNKKISVEKNLLQIIAINPNFLIVSFSLFLVQLESSQIVFL